MRFRFAAVECVTVLLIVACPVGIWLWLKSSYDRAMFEPQTHDKGRVVELLKPHFGARFNLVEVVRVDRDVGAWYFVIEYEGDPNLANWSPPPRPVLSENGSGTYVSSTSGKLRSGGSAWYRYEIMSPDYSIVVRLESLDSDTYYGGLAMRPSRTFEKRFEENRKYATIGD